MALNKVELSKLIKALDQRYASLLEEVRDALEKSENQQYVELVLLASSSEREPTLTKELRRSDFGLNGPTRTRKAPLRAEHGENGLPLSVPLMRNQHRDSHLCEQHPRRSAKDALAPAWMAVSAHHDQVHAQVGRSAQRTCVTVKG
jgi:hypothetical protein